MFGLASRERYSALMREHLPLSTRIRMRERAMRVWFATAYPHLKDVEERFFSEHECYLPVGLHGDDRSAQWRGTDARLFFVCPRIGSTPYFRGIYERFKRDFGDLPHVIGGAQPIAVNDPAVIGYMPKDEHERNMRELRVMYYHSREPNHAHYHPFEAVYAGMPLVFMAGGMLDQLGGRHLPGRCRTEAQAHRKIERLLAGDRRLIDSIRTTQSVLLESMSPERCMPQWQRGFARIVASAQTVTPRAGRTSGRRIAIIVPVGYRGGSLRGAKLLAQALVEGSRAAGEPAEVVLAHLDDDQVYTDEEFKDMPAYVGRRSFRWKTLNRDEARRALAYAGVDASLHAPVYAVPDDGATHFDDCDLWLVVSDRLSVPLLPVKPYVMMVYDYLQRYESFLDAGSNAAFISAQHSAERVFVTTDFTYADARDFAGLPLRKLRRVPMLVPQFEAASQPSEAVDAERTPYFIWTTNLALHKNHENAANALAIYYDELDGRWGCRVTGVETDRILASELPHLKPVREIRAQSRRFRRNVEFMGELPERAYQRLLGGARFLWHAGRVDNGTFSVVEAAHVGVPALTSDYPAMREIVTANRLAVEWMDAHDPEQMASRLKAMEQCADVLRGQVPDRATLAANGVERHAAAYWREVRECL